MSFSLPWVLLLIPPAWFLLRRSEGKPVVLSGLAGWRAAKPPRRVRMLPALRWLRYLFVSLLLTALAGPRIEHRMEEDIRSGIAIQMLIDISSSMDRWVTGIDGERTTRMEAVKRAAEEFIRNRPEDLIGLISFARYADTLSPLTFGHSALIELVRELSIQDRPFEDGTAIGDALALACAHLIRMDEWQAEPQLGEADPARLIASKVVVLLTDGENNCGRFLPQEAVAIARREGIRIHTINISDLTDVEERTDAERLLEVLTESTGGLFWKMSDDYALLDEAYRMIDELEKTDIPDTTRTVVEDKAVFARFALPALILLLLERLLACGPLRVAREEMVYESSREGIDAPIS